MAQIVQSDGWEATRLTRPREQSGEVLRLQSTAVFHREDQAAVDPRFGAPGKLSGPLALPVGLQDVDGALVEAERADTGLRFRGPIEDLAPNLSALYGDRDHVLIKVDIGPAQPCCLATPQTERGDQMPKRSV
ncbi:MAG: hypothetical protein H7323_08550 [Frankiales bacterium]|nr:hypothetical protein [Frankiales bacterium]